MFVYLYKWGSLLPPAIPGTQIATLMDLNLDLTCLIHILLRKIQKSIVGKCSSFTTLNIYIYMFLVNYLYAMILLKVPTRKPRIMQQRTEVRQQQLQHWLLFPPVVICTSLLINKFSASLQLLNGVIMLLLPLVSSCLLELIWIFPLVNDCWCW